MVAVLSLSEIALCCKGGGSKKVPNLIIFEIPQNQETVTKNDAGITSISFRPDGDYSSLKTLNLARNKIQIHDVQFLANLKTLENLDVSQNSLDIFDLAILSKFENMRDFSAMGNKIPNLENTLTENVPKIEHLDFSFNNLTVVDLETFKFFPNLRELNLNGNQIIKIENSQNVRSFLPKIQWITLEQNVWKCKDLLETVNHLKSLSIAWTTRHPEKICDISHKTGIFGDVCCYA